MVEDGLPAEITGYSSARLRVEGIARLLLGECHSKKLVVQPAKNKL